MTLNQLIRTSYGCDDHLFANHELDRQNAVLALVKANEESIGMAEFFEKHRNYLQSKNCSEEHIEKQFQRIRDINLYFKND